MNEPESKIRHGTSQWILWVCLAGFVAWIGLGPLGQIIIREAYGFDSATMGQFGDWHGMINSLFSAGALVGVIIAIVLQRNELELQREELRLAREEHRRSAEAQESAAKELRNQVQAPLVLEFMRELRTDEMNSAMAGITGYAVENASPVPNGNVEKQDFAVSYGRARIRDLPEIRTNRGYRYGYYEITSWHRHLLMYYHTVARLAEVGIIDAPLARVVVREDIAAIALLILEPLETEIDINYDQSAFRYVQSLYSYEQIISKKFIWIEPFKRVLAQLYGVTEPG